MTIKEFNQETLLEKALALANQERSQSDFFAYLQNAKSFTENYEGICEEHKGKIVGIFEGKVWFSSGDVLRIGEALRDHSFKNQVYFRYVPKEKEMLLL